MPRRPQITIPVDADLRSWLNAKAAKDVGTVASVARRILVEAMRADTRLPLRMIKAVTHEDVEAALKIERALVEDEPTVDEQAADPFAGE
jgi:hypothetical protein